MRRKTTCFIDGCHNSGKIVKGLCRTHYMRLQRRGDPLLVTKTEAGVSRRYLFEVVVPHRGEDCLIWPYARNGSGYGYISTPEHQYAHRAACEAINGPAPSSTHEAAHLCGNGHLGCVNPTHLMWKTRKENHADKRRHGTLQWGEKHTLSKLTEDDVRQIRALVGTMPQKQIAERFGVAQSRVSKIANRLEWRWLD